MKILLLLLLFGAIAGFVVWLIIASNKGSTNGSPPGPGPYPNPSPNPQPNSAVAQAFLNQHNKYRTLNGVNTLTWNDNLASWAQKWGDYISQNCEMRHPENQQEADTYLDNDNWGQNLAEYQGNPGSPSAAVDGWMNECTIYNPANPLVGTHSINGNNETGHMTQLLWRGSTEVGCAVSTCPDGSKMYTCNYNPAGNIVDDTFSYFKANVPNPVKCPF